jgi:hypothetical protein
VEEESSEDLVLRDVSEENEELEERLTEEESWEPSTEESCADAGCCFVCFVVLTACLETVSAETTEEERSTDTLVLSANSPSVSEEAAEQDAEERTRKCANWEEDHQELAEHLPSEPVETSQLDHTRRVRESTESTAEDHVEKQALLLVWEREPTFASRTTRTPSPFKEEDWELNVLNNLVPEEQKEQKEEEEDVLWEGRVFVELLLLLFLFLILMK